MEKKKYYCTILVALFGKARSSGLSQLYVEQAYSKRNFLIKTFPFFFSSTSTRKKVYFAKATTCLKAAYQKYLNSHQKTSSLVGLIVCEKGKSILSKFEHF